MANTGNKYELMVIVDSGIGQANVDKRLESIKKHISKHGEIFFEDVWGEKDFGYTIKGKTKGHYAVYGFSFEPQELKEFETSLKLEPEVVRHLIVKVALKYEPKSLESMTAAHAAAKEAAAAQLNSGTSKTPALVEKK